MKPAPKKPQLKPCTQAEVTRGALRADALLLRQRGLTLPQIATTLGVSRSTITRWLQ